ncbi:hypothetical protein ARH82_12950, partial [Listeria monocytogenes]|nr:hypothetical protein [Listeria monocytogenes]
DGYLLRYFNFASLNCLITLYGFSVSKKAITKYLLLKFLFLVIVPDSSTKSLVPVPPLFYLNYIILIKFEEVERMYL